MIWFKKKEENTINMVGNYRVDSNGRFLDIETAEDLPKELPPSLTFGELFRWHNILYRDFKKEYDKLKIHNGD